MNLLGKIWKKWLVFGRFMGDWAGRVVMTIFYFSIAAPFGLAMRFLSDPLKLRAGEPHWEQRTTEQPAVDDMKRAF